MRELIILLIFSLMIISCDKINREHKVNKEELLSSDYRIFQDTPAWELAKAVWDEDIDKIKKEVKKTIRRKIKISLKKLEDLHLFR